MAILEQIVAHLDAYEKSEFMSYVERQPRLVKEVGFWKLVLVNNPLPSGEIRDLLYPDTGKGSGREAYKSMRKQALDRILQWIAVYRMDAERSTDGPLYLYILTGRFMLERNAVDSAAWLLQQAEKIAEEGRNYEVLESIYCYLIAHAVQMDMKVQDIILRWEKNRKRYDRICLLQRVFAIQRQRVRDAKQKGLALDPELTIRKIFREVQVTKEDANDPAFLLLFTRILRSTIASGKDYTAFERFVGSIYHRLKKKGILTPGDREIELGFLYMYAHACYRNRHFEQAESLCRDIGHILGERGARLHPVYPQYMAVRAGIAALTGRNAEAIELMESALRYRVDSTEISEWLNNQLNLAVYYFQADNFRKAKRCLLQIEGDDAFLVREMGLEWCFKKSMIELIVQYELGNEDLALKMCDAITYKYTEMLDQQIYNRARLFLRFIRRLIHDPAMVTSPEFQAEVKNAQLAWPNYKEDVQAITFFCWLLSKMVQKPYYEVLLKRLDE